MSDELPLSVHLYTKTDQSVFYTSGEYAAFWHMVDSSAATPVMYDKRVILFGEIINKIRMIIEVMGATKTLSDKDTRAATIIQ